MERRKFLKAAVMANLGFIATPEILAGKIKNRYADKAKKIKIGQIGICHEHASGIMNTLRMMPNVFEIVGVVDDRVTKAARFAGDNLKPYEGLKWLTEEELFNTPGLQAVTIETPNADLVPTALRCIEHNLAIHMDKPGGEDLPMFGRLMDGCETRNIPFHMGYMFRNNPAMLFSRKAIEKNWLGDIFEICTDMSHDYGGENYQKYLSHYKGGIMFNIGCHPIDFVVSILGRPTKVTPFQCSTKDAANGAKNNCLAVIEYPNTLVHISACDLSTKGIYHRRMKICGTKGSIEYSPIELYGGTTPLKLQLILKEGNEEYVAGTHTVNFGTIQDRYEEHMMEFARIIHGEIKNPYTYEHNYLTQEVVLAASGYIRWNK